MFKYVNIFGILDSVSYLLGFLISSVSFLPVGIFDLLCNKVQLIPKK